jgi:hypothetical protein
VSELLGLIGTLVVFAGLHLLWQARHEIFFWLETYFRIFRASLMHPGQRVRLAEVTMQSSDRHTLRMLLGIGLVFVIGPALIVLGLTQ